MKSIFTLFAIWLTSALSFGQFGLTPSNFPFSITKDGNLQSLAGVGGMNNPQPSLADFDGDGVDELYVFDRSGDVHLAFRSTGNAADPWTYDRSLTAGWPKAVGFVLLRDFDADGIADLFSHGDLENQSGIVVYKGFRQNGRLTFDQVLFPDKPANVLYYGDRGEDKLMYVAISDIPAIADINGDGLLDVLSFDNAGGYIDYYVNIGPRFGNPSTYLRFERETRCFGGVYETNVFGLVNLSSTPGDCADPLRPNDPPILESRSGIHPGSTITPFDTDGDGDLDLLMGDVNTGFITELTNSPTATTDFFTDVNYSWPEPSNLVMVDNFPAVFPLDLQSSGVEEFLVSPSSPGGGENYNCFWRYAPSSENPGSLDLLERDYLTKDAFDHGTGAHLTFGDLTGDGKDDILVGNDFYYLDRNELFAELAFYASTPTGYVEQNPAWLSSLNSVVTPSLVGLHPVLFDMDADGDLDLLLGSDEGFISYAENIGGSGGAANFSGLVAQWMGIDVGTLSAPAVADLTGDGLPDLLVGERRGKLAFFPNVGSRTNPQFNATAATDLYGNIDVRIPGFNSNVNTKPAFVTINGTLALYIGSGQGRLLVYTDLPASVGPTAELQQEVEVSFGEDISPAFGRDLNGAVVAALGTSRGGVGFYRIDAINSTSQRKVNYPAWEVYPNPSRGELLFRSLDTDVELRVTTTLGQQHVYKQEDFANLILADGLYFITPVSVDGVQLGETKRVIIGY